MAVQRGGQTKQTDKHANRQTDGQTGERADRQTAGQTDEHRFTDQYGVGGHGSAVQLVSVRPGQVQAV